MVIVCGAVIVSGWFPGVMTDRWEHRDTEDGGGVPLVVAAKAPVIRLQGASLPGWWTIHRDWSHA
jgi:hypothetical protein